MNRLWIRACAALLLAVMTLMLMTAPKAEPAMNVRASAFALIDAESGRLLFGKNENLRLPMASTTKIMTALVTLESCALDEMVGIPDEAVGAEGSSMYLERGESLSVRDLLYGLMLASGNDAAVALAVHVGGSVKDFVGLMNVRADSMGLRSTHFITPNGLSAEGHLTTARELCLIAREAMKNEDFAQIVSTKYYRTETGGAVRSFKNKNSLLWSYDGAFGIKTGYTMAAGRCLVFGAERNGMRVIGAVLNCRPMFDEAARLMDLAFESFVPVTVIGKGTRVFDVYVENSEECLLEVSAKDSIIRLMRSNESALLCTEYELYPDLSPPIRAGDEVGVLRIRENGETIGSTALVASNTVLPYGYGYWWKLLSKRFAA